MEKVTQIIVERPISVFSPSYNSGGAVGRADEKPFDSREIHVDSFTPPALQNGNMEAFV